MKNLKDMKKILFLFGMIFLMAISSYAQPPKPEGRFDQDQFKANKIAFLSQAMDLTPTEAEKFWPLYNQLENERNRIFEERIKLDEKIMKAENLSEREYATLSRKVTSLFKEESEYMTKYNEEFLKILPAKKVVGLYRAEYQFRQNMLRQFRNKRHNQDPEQKE